MFSWLLTVQLIDTHVHINFESYALDLDDVAERWRTAGVVGLVHSCVDPSEFCSIQALADRFPELVFSVGLHPLSVAQQWTSQSAAEIHHLVQQDRRVVAVGEIGLDFHKASNDDQQAHAFWAQLAIAYELGKPVIIHCRDAALPMAEQLRQFWQQYGPVPGVMHCWGGTPEQVRWFLDLGFHISFSGTVTFSNASDVRASAQVVPSHRLLIETDCPFLSPSPKRGQRNEPAHVQHVAEHLAHLRGVAVEELATQATTNACHLFGLPLSNSVTASRG